MTKNNLVDVQEDRTNGKLTAVRIVLSDGRIIFTDGITLELVEAFPHAGSEIRVKL
jgi:hypothetical protein